MMICNTDVCKQDLRNNMRPMDKRTNELFLRSEIFEPTVRFSTHLKKMGYRRTDRRTDGQGILNRCENASKMYEKH